MSGTTCCALHLVEDHVENVPQPHLRADGLLQSEDLSLACVEQS